MSFEVTDLKSKSRDELILLWKNTKEQVDQLDAYEKQLRQELVAREFNSAKEEGTESIDLGNGWKLTSTKTKTYKVVGNAQALVNVLPDAWKELFKFKPELSVSKYKELLTVVKAANTLDFNNLLKEVDSIIETKPGMPQLKLVEPKEEK